VELDVDAGALAQSIQLSPVDPQELRGAPHPAAGLLERRHDLLAAGLLDRGGVAPRPRSLVAAELPAVRADPLGQPFGRDRLLR